MRVFVVDDYEPFRRFVCATLGQMQDLQVIGEASDGLEAVRRAEELQPDLMVLDIGLPKLNGIEVARRMRKLCPECKMLFMSQESSADLVQEAFNLGALESVPFKIFNHPSTHRHREGQTRSVLQTDQRDTAVTSESGTVKSNPDSSVDIYFGPEPPAGEESNWIQTVPGKGWFTLLRLYGALEPWFEKTWRPGEIELVE